jgi:hypothetical protein
MLAEGNVMSDLDDFCDDTMPSRGMTDKRTSRFDAYMIYKRRNIIEDNVKEIKK